MLSCGVLDLGDVSHGVWFRVCVEGGRRGEEGKMERAVRGLT